MIKADTRPALMSGPLFLGLLVVLLSGSVVGQGLTAEEERGREIYLHGVSPSGQAIIAQFGKDGPQLPASSVPCANCHGRDGRGRREGGVTPSDLRWLQLTRETSAGSGVARPRPAYTDRLLTRAFTMGLDSGGTVLNSVMPLYHLQGSDAHDLIAYMKTLGVKPEPGVLDTSVRVGAILPPHGSTAVREALIAYFHEAAQQEEIFGRHIELETLNLPDDSAQGGKAVRDFIRDRSIFALVAGFVTGSEKEVVAALDDIGVPLILGVTPFPPSATDRYAFFLDGGIPSQTEALANYAIAAHTGSPPKVLILHSSGGVEQHMADAAFEQFRTAGWTEVQRVVLGSDSDLTKLRELHPDIVMLLSNNISQKELVAWPKTMFLVPGVLLSPDAIASPLMNGSSILTAFPILPSDFAGEGLAEYRALAKKYQLQSSDLQAQLAALCGAKVLVELLRRSGRDLSREKLVETEEGLTGLEIGWTPAFNFAPNQHIAIPTPRVVEVDSKNHKFVQVR
ncbi:MAG TPA: ABC transporter substrate-binding protein [Candidatus Angelobacter sp.]